MLNGAVEPVQQSIEVTAAQLANLSFQSGSGNDLLWVRASDGFQWSSWQSFTVAAPVDHAPVVTAPDQQAAHRQSFAASSLFSFTDADNDTIARYRVLGLQRSVGRLLHRERRGAAVQSGDRRQRGTARQRELPERRRALRFSMCAPTTACCGAAGCRSTSMRPSDAGAGGHRRQRQPRTSARALPSHPSSA